MFGAGSPLARTIDRLGGIEKPQEIGVKLWKIRQKSTGLFWNDVRWAKLEGTFAEARVHDIDEDREMVYLVMQAPPPPAQVAAPSGNPPLIVGDNVRIRTGFPNEGLLGTVTNVNSPISVELTLNPGQSLPPWGSGGNPWVIHTGALERIATSRRVGDPWRVGDKVKFKSGPPVAQNLQGLTGVIVGRSMGVSPLFKVLLDQGQTVKPMRGGHDALDHFFEEETAPGSTQVVHNINGSFTDKSGHPFWPRTNHPSTNEPFVRGDIVKKPFITMGGLIVAGENLLEGKFWTTRGDTAEGTYAGSPGGTWQWTTSTNLP